MKKGMYYRADDEEAVDAFCHDCAPQNYSAWEDVTGEEICSICGAQITTN